MLPQTPSSVPQPLGAKPMLFGFLELSDARNAVFPRATPAHPHPHRGGVSQFSSRVPARRALLAQFSAPGPPRTVLAGLPAALRAWPFPPRPPAAHPGPVRPQLAGFARTSGRSGRTPPHLRVCTVGLYLPLFLFLKSEFMVAVGVRGRSGSWAVGGGKALRAPRGGSGRR